MMRKEEGEGDGLRKWQLCSVPEVGRRSRASQVTPQCLKEYINDWYSAVFADLSPNPCSFSAAFCSPLLTIRREKETKQAEECPFPKNGQ